MIKDKILFVTNEETYLLFDGTDFSPIEAKKSKNYYCGGVISAPLLRHYGMRVPENISPEKLEIQAEMSMYEEAGLDPDIDFKIASISITLEDAGEKFLESYAIENSVLTESFSQNISKLGHLDFLVPSFLKYNALYAYEKIERKNDVFIYFGEDEAYAVMYKDGHYISTRTITTLNELGEKLGVQVPELKTLLCSKGVENDNYTPDEFLKMRSIQEELSKIVERIAHAIGHKRGIFGFDRVDRFFIDFEGQDIPGFLQLFENYGFDTSVPLALKVFDNLEPEQYNDALSALYILGIVQEKYTSANLTIFERRAVFYKTHSGVFFIVLGFAVVLGLAYPIYGSYQLSILEAKRFSLEEKVDAMDTLTKKLQKKLKEVRLERKSVEANRDEIIATIASYDELVDTLKAQKQEKKARQLMMQDVNMAMAKYKLSSRNLDQNGSSSMRVHIISEYEKRDDIAKFMKELLHAGYLHVSTREIKRKENIYESIIEIRP